MDWTWWGGVLFLGLLALSFLWIMLIAVVEVVSAALHLGPYANGVRERFDFRWLP